MRRLRIFISSPGDVSAERVIALQVIARLAQEFARHVQLEAIDWRHEPIRATADFQSQIPSARESDVCVLILWSRLGTPIKAPDGKAYNSGTEYEFLDALEGARAHGTPDLLVYRKLGEAMFSARLSEDEAVAQLRQQRAVEAFIERWFRGEGGTFIAGFHEFSTAGDFEERLESHLRKLLRNRLDDDQKEPAPWSDRSPYRGLSVFDFEHSLIYCGRASATLEIVSSLRKQAENGRPFVLIVGASGAGKSSLMRAGALPMLTRPNVVEGVRIWRRTLVRPAEVAGDLVEGLASALTGPEALPGLLSGGSTIAELAAALRDAPQTAVVLMRRELAAIADETRIRDNLDAPPKALFALALDQFEEIFAERRVEAERRAFIAAIAALVRSGLVWTMATVRSDFYSRCAEIAELMALKEGAGQFDLGPPTLAEIGRMVRQPARMAGLRFEKRAETDEQLDDLIVSDAAAEPSALPLLEFVLEALHSRSTDGLLTFDCYRALGGLEGALANHAETTFLALDEKLRNALPELFAALASAGLAEDNRIVQRRPLKSELRGESLMRLVDALIEARLFTTGETDRGEPTVGVAHEALLRRWPRAIDWIERNRAGLRVRAQISSVAALWKAENRAAAFLLPEGALLKSAEALIAERRLRFEPDELQFVESSMAAARRRRRTARRWRIAAGVALLVPVLAAAAYWFAFVADHVEYYESFVKRWGSPIGVVRLTEEQTRHRTFSLQFHRNGYLGEVEQIRVVDSTGQCARAHPMTQYGTDTTAYNNTSKRECVWEFRRIGSRVYSETGIDRVGRIAFLFQYNAGRPNVAEFTDNQGASLSRQDTKASRIVFDWVADGPLAGYEAGYRTTDAAGAPTAMGNGTYGSHEDLDEWGRPVRVTFLGADGKAAPNKAGVAYVTDRYDGEGRVASSSFFGADGKPVDNAGGVARADYEFDRFGNIVATKFWNARSERASGAKCAGRLTRFDDLGREVDEICVDPEGRPEDDTEGAAELASVYDANGQCVTLTERRADGSAVAYGAAAIGKKACFDASGDIETLAIVDAQGRPAPTNVGVAFLKMDHDASGDVTRTTMFDVQKRPGRLGAVIVEVAPGGQAEKLGLQPGDAIIRYGGHDANGANLRALVDGNHDDVDIQFLRQGAMQTVRAKSGLLGIRSKTYFAPENQPPADR